MSDPYCTAQQFPPSFDQEREKIIKDLQASRENLLRQQQGMQTQILQLEKDLQASKDTNIALANRVSAQHEILSKNAETGIKQHEGKKYLRSIVGATSSVEYIEVEGKKIPMIEVDVYAVLRAFSVVSQPIGHAVKKLLACGQRGKGNIVDDLKGVLAAVSRAIEQQKTYDAMEKSCNGHSSSSTPTISVGEPSSPPEGSSTE